MSLYKYRIYCNTESAWAYKWDEQPPSLCPNHPNHTVNFDSVSIADKIERNEVIALDGNQGYYQGTCIKSTFPAGTNTNVVSFPHDIAFYCCSFQALSDHIGDKFSVAVAPNTVIGVITAQLSTGQTTLTISPDIFSLNILFKGVWLKIGSFDLGRVTGFSSVNNTISFENGADQDYSAMEPVTMTAYLIKDQHIYTEKEFWYGRKGLATKRVEKDTEFHIIYENNGVNSKDFYLDIEFNYY